MSRYYPTMKMRAKPSDGVDDMYNVHGHVGDVCRAAIADGLGNIISSRRALHTEKPIGIADFGTADGCASLSLINEMIDTLHGEMGKEEEILVYYNDQPKNDFNLLSEVLQGNKTNTGLHVSSNVYPALIPRTMYEQCLPDNTLDLAISTVATQYLSKQVCQIENGVFISGASEIESKMMREQSKADWKAFLVSRGKELKSGGYLITLNVSSNDQKETSMAVANGMMTLDKIVLEMKRDGIITQGEYLATNCNSYYLRMPADFKEPFTNAAPEVKELGLELVSMRSFKHYPPNPVFDIVSKDEVQKLAYARQIVRSIYPWMYHILEGGLAVSRTDHERQAIIDLFFDRLQKYAFDNSDFRPFIIFTEVVIRKAM